MLLFLAFNSAYNVAYGQEGTGPTSTSGYVNESSVGLLWSGASALNPIAVSVQSYNAYRVSKMFSIGGSIGYDEYFGLGLFPLTAGARLVFPGERVSWFLGFDGGYGFPWFQENTLARSVEGGWTVNPAFGWRWKQKSVGVDRYFISLGYKHQKAVRHSSTTFWGRDARETERFKLHRLSMHVGLVF